MADRTFTLKFVGDVADAQRGLRTMEGDVNSFKSTTVSAFTAIGAAVSVAAVVEFGKATVTAASDSEQALGASSAVFKEFSDEVQAFGQTTAANLGLSEAEFNQLASTTGALMKNAGVPMNEVTDSTIALTERAADMAAMFGGDVSTAMEAINSGLKGELDPLEQFGVSLKASTVDAKAAALGYTDADGKVTEYGRTMARVALIMEQSADAQGASAREADTAAGSAMRLKAQFTDMQAELGAKLLPVLVQVTGALTGLVSFVSGNMNWLLPLAAGIAAVVVGIKAWQMAQTAWSAATKIATGVQWLFNAAMTANPIGLIVAAIAAVVAAVVLLYTKVDWFRAGVDAAIDGIVAAWNWLLSIIQGVFSWIQANWPLLLAIITGPIGVAVGLVVTHWDTIKNAVMGVYNWIAENWPLLLAIITGPFGIAVGLVVTHWDTIKSTVSGAVDAITGFVANIWDIISAPFNQGKDIIVETVEGIKDIFRDLPGQIGDFISGVASVITAPFEDAFNGIRNLWNNTIGGFGFSVPSWVPGVGGNSFTIPSMAKGGIVHKPTIALIGEAGPEAVVPLSRGFATGGATINVYALTATSEVGRKVYEALKEYERTTGNRFA